MGDILTLIFGLLIGFECMALNYHWREEMIEHNKWEGVENKSIYYAGYISSLFWITMVLYWWFTYGGGVN